MPNPSGFWNSLPPITLCPEAHRFSSPILIEKYNFFYNFRGMTRPVR